MSRVKIRLDHKRIQHLIWLVLVVFILLDSALKSAAGSSYYSMATQTYANVSSPPVILEEGIVGSSTIYSNNTSAKVSVAASVSPQTYDYVLRVVNQVSGNWTINLQVYNSINIDRLSSLNISLYDGNSSNQIAISEGSIVKSEGEPYNLSGGLGSTIYVSMSNLEATTTDTSYIYVDLKILTPNTSTYILYVIIFEIT